MLDASYQICWSVDSWRQAVLRSQQSRFRGLDFESRPFGFYDQSTSALRAEQGAEVASIGIAWFEGEGSNRAVRSAFVPIRHDRRFVGGDQPDPRHCLEVLSDSVECMPDDAGIVVANLQMELSMMLREQVKWPLQGQIHDIQIAARVLNKAMGPQELIGLDALQKGVLGKTELDSLNELDRWLVAHKFKKGADIWHAPAAIVGWYCQDDARDTLLIWDRWQDDVYQRPTKWWWTRPPDRLNRKDLYEVEIEAGIHALMTCLRGTRVDLQLARRKSAAAKALQLACTRWIREKLEMPTLNPGSQTQLRGIFFTEAFGFKVSLAHMTESFKKLKEHEQAKILAGKGEKRLVDFASLDVDALEHYAAENPQHENLLFMLAVYRKCTKALEWFDANVEEWAMLPAIDPWWNESSDRLTNLIYHRLRTVGTKSGRMASSEYNGQQLPKRFKMLIDALLLGDILGDFLPEAQLQELWGMLDFAPVKKGDEAKVLGLNPGSTVVDFSIRAMMIPRPNYNIASWDLSQVEMVGFAHFSGNPLLCNGYGAPMLDDEVNRSLDAALYFMEHGRLPEWTDLERHARLAASPFDIHKFVAEEVGTDRKGAKGMNFGTVYGMGKKKMARQMGWGSDQAAKYFRTYHRRFPEIMELQGQITTVLRKRGYIFDPFGRRYYLPINKAYVGLNRLIQGWAASVYKVGFVRNCEMLASSHLGGSDVHPITRRRMTEGAHFLSCIHDESLGEVPVELDTPELDWSVRTNMTSFHGLKVPLGTSSERSDRSWDACA